jgi:CheY-like chemotaxis protein
MTKCGRILIVDDSKLVRVAVRRELGGAHEYREAKHGLEALQIIRDGFTPDLITLDIEMPELGGFETCERLYSPEFARFFPANREGRVPVVFLTARDTLAERRRGFELGAIDFVSKQFEPGALAVLVDQILNPGERLRGVHVLLVDDSRMIRQIVGNALRDVGVDVIEAVDGLEGFSILCNRLSSIDLVITDIEMPVMSGTELCRRIRHEIGLVDLPIVFFTGADQAQRVAAFQAGATDCLVKPFIKEEMISRLNVHIEKALLNSRLRHTVAELRNAIKCQRDMLATLSHDMRAPLSGVMGFADLLFMGPNRTPTELENIDLIKQSGQMLLSLVEDILSLSKQQSGRSELELQPLELGPLLARSVAMLQSLAARKHQEIVFNQNTKETAIAGHAESLMRVFNNLISNALKFTADGGNICVSLDPAPPGKLAVVVADTGIGIPPQQMAHIFDRYSQSSQRGTAGEASTGLGMSIVREFVEAHKGEVTVTSQPGRGTQFRVTFPLSQVAPATQRSAAERTVNESHHAHLGRKIHGRRVLVADDNPVNHMVAEAILTNAGCSSKAVTNGRDAVETLLATPLAFDLVLMDMQMPGMDGPAATRAIRIAGLVNIPVIALTGSADEADREVCLAAGMNDFLTKPFTPRALLEVIGRHAGAGAASPDAGVIHQFPRTRAAVGA